MGNLRVGGVNKRMMVGMMGLRCQAILIPGHFVSL